MLAALCAILLQGCAGTPATPPFPTGLPVSVELADTPFLAQDDYQCGPAALAMVLRADGVEVTPEQLRPEVYLPGRRGSLQAEMLAAASRHARLALRLPPDLNSLLGEVAAGRPVLVLQNLGHRLLPVWHYAVVIGYDLDAGELYLRSGTEARKVYSLQRFLDSWTGAGRWAVVVVRPDEVPATASPRSWLEAASALERGQHTAAALRAYRAGTRRWPEHALLWAASGNAAYALQRFKTAADAYRRALALAPDNPSILNNLALALAAQGCAGQARRVLACALALAPGNPDLMETRQEISGLKDKADGCEAFACAPAPLPEAR